MKIIEDEKTHIVIPDSEMEIGESAFRGRTSLTSIVIPDSVTKIGGYAFHGCKGLTDIVIPDSVTEIGEWAFGGCTSLISIVIPKSVTKIGGYAFCGCTSLASIIIPDSVTEIRFGTFHYCTNLTNLVLPDSVTKKKEKYANDELLLILKKQNSKITPIDDYSQNNGGEVYSEPLNSIGFKAIEEFHKNIIMDHGDYIEFKEPIDGIYMIQKSFSENASFENALEYAKELTLGGFNDWQVPTIGNLKTIQRLKDILHLNITDSKELFWSSSWFYDLRIRYYNGFEQPCKIRYVINFRDGYVFDYDECDIKCNFFCVRIAMEKMCTHDTKYYPDLTSIVIPNTVMKIGESAFFHCIGLTSVVIPNSIKIIDKYAFEGCKSLKSIVIPDSVTEIGDSAFKWCTGLTSVVISSSVKEIGNCAFYGCERLTSIVIPDSVTKIGDRAFENCTGLTSIVISSSVKEIGDCAFYGCESLVDIKIIGNNKKFGDEVFANCTRLSQGSKYVVAQCKYAYNNNDKAIVQLENNFVDRGDYIEFIEPINGIVMVQKDCSISLDWEGAKEYAKTMNLGGFNDWAIPRIHELQTLYDIKEFCGIKETNNCFWSSSYRSYYFEEYGPDCDMYHEWNEDRQQTLNFYNGKIIGETFLSDYIEDESFKTISPHVRCIRTINVDEERLDRYYEGRYYESMGHRNHGGCFITTAVCKTFGKPDDCPELTAFRVFRDTYMANKKDLNQEVQKYYEIAPAICAAIDAKGDELAKQEYARIWDKYLSKAFKALKNNELKKTYDIYKEMVLSLEEDYLS